MQKIYESGLGCVKDITRTLIDKGVTDFGLVDQKGRACGYEWTISAMTAVKIGRASCRERVFTAV